jgi:hypothetical protein
MKEIRLGRVPVGAEAKLDWCIDAIQKIAIGSRENDPNSYVDAFDASNVTESRSFDADTVTTAELADVVGTLVSDFKRRGSKRT